MQYGGCFAFFSRVISFIIISDFLEDFAGIHKQSSQSSAVHCLIFRSSDKKRTLAQLGNLEIGLKLIGFTKYNS